MSKHSWLQILTLVIIWNPTRRPSLPWEGPREGGVILRRNLRWNPSRPIIPWFYCLSAHDWSSHPSAHFIVVRFMTGPTLYPPPAQTEWLLALEEFACIDRFKVPMIWIQNKNSVFVNTCEPQSVKQSDDVLWCPSYLLLVQKISLIKSDITISTNTQSNLLNDYKMLRSG